MTTLQVAKLRIFTAALVWILASGFRQRPKIQGRLLKQRTLRHRSNDNDTVNHSVTAFSHVDIGGSSQHIAPDEMLAHADSNTTFVHDGVPSLQYNFAASFLDKTFYSKYVRHNTAPLLMALLLIVPAVVAFSWCAWVRYSRSKLNLLADVDDTISEDDNSEIMFAPQLSEKLITEATSVDVEFIEPEWTSQALSGVLRQYKVDPQACKAEHIESLACELWEGKARMCREGKTLQRVVDVVTVILTYRLEELIIQEVAHPEYTRDFEISGQSMKTKIEPEENLVECATRCLCDRLGIDKTEGHIQISPDILTMSEIKEMDDLLPGMMSRYRIFVVEANVISTDVAFLEQIGIPRRTLHIDDYLYKWDNIAIIGHERKQLELKTTSPKAQSGIRWNILNHSLTPVMPWGSDDIKQELKKHGMTDNAPFGRTLESLLAELQDGKIKLGINRKRVNAESRGRLVCVSEEVSAVLQSRSGEVLVPDGSSTKLLRRVSQLDPCPGSCLASSTKLANESIWNATLRLSQMNLKLTTPIFSLEARLLCTNDLLSHQGNFLRRKFIVTGPMTPEY